MKNIQKVSLQKRARRGVVTISTKLAIAIALVLSLVAGPTTAKADDHITQLTYLQWLVKVSGDSGQFNNSSTAQDYVNWALAKGIVPNGGWKADHKLNRDQLATTLVQYLGLQSGKKGGDPIKTLQREGLDLLVALADSEEVTKKGLLFIFDDDMFRLRIPGHSPHGPPPGRPPPVTPPPVPPGQLPH